MRKKFTKLLRYFGYILFRPIWWLERLVPRNKKIWVFGAWYGQKYSDNSKWLYEYVLKHNPEIKAVWITKSLDVFNKLKSQGKPVCMSSSFTGALCCFRAKYVFLSSTQLDVNNFFINGAKQIWLWHGMPLKKILKSENNIRNFKSRLFNLLNPYQKLKPYATITASTFFISFLKEAFALPENKIWKTGLPRCDAFYSGKEDSYIDTLKHNFPYSRLILYMPTFRKTVGDAGESFNPFIKQFDFDDKQFVDFLEENNVVFLYKPHFVDSDITIPLFSDRFILLNDKMFDDLYILLNNVDVLLTDYSSVYFDFLSAKKNIYLLPFDYENYTKESRRHYFNMFGEMKGFVCKDWSAFYDAYSTDLMKLDEDNLKFNEFNNGNSCKVITDRILALEKGN